MEKSKEEEVYEEYYEDNKNEEKMMKIKLMRIKKKI